MADPSASAIFYILSLGVAGVLTAASTLSNPVVAAVGGQTMSAFDEILKVTPPALVAFLANLPIIEGKLQNLSFH